MSPMKTFTASQILFVTCLLTVLMVVSLPTQTKAGKSNLDSAKRNGCPGEELSKVPSRYAKNIQSRLLNIINFARPDVRYWIIKQQNFKGRLLLWGFKKMDQDGNGLVDYKEAVSGKWSLQGSRVCRLAFIQSCDKDQSKRVSRKEWQNCLKITPVCNKSCVRGQLDTVNCQCQCSRRAIQGRIVTSHGAPLQDVSILLGSNLNNEMARTNRSGHFSLIDSCENSSYIVTKNNYIPFRIEGSIQSEVFPLLIHLESAEPAYITINPKTKMRIVGQSVNFTCDAEGTLPIKISWYHNGTRLVHVTSRSRSNLFIPDVNGAQGLYTCKASNIYGSEVSTPAELKIKDEILDTCNRTPSRHIIHLPPGCKVKDTGEDTLDIGQCSDDPCSRSSSFNQTCGGKEDCCCGPRKGVDYQERVVLSCVDGSSEIAFHRVKECSCSTCVLKTTMLKGNVVGGQTKAPVRNISVIFRQKEVDRTNKDGTFSFIIPDNADRVTLTFQDPTDQFLDTTQTIPFQRGQTVFHRIVLQKEDPPVTFDSGQELKVPLGHAEDNMAVLEMPADNLLHKDGKPFKGKAKLRVSLMDPRNASDLFSAPGDFTTVDQSGSIQPLKTYGILRIKVQDQDDKPLDLAGNMKIYLDTDKIMLPSNSTGQMVPWLWWLDEKTGRWREMGEMKLDNKTRTKRASDSRRYYIGDIPADRISNINIDIPWKRCYVRAQAFTLTRKGMQPVARAVFTVIGRENEENTDQEQYYGYTREFTDKHGIACVPAWCDSYVFLMSSDSDGNNQLNPDHTTLDKLPPELETSVIEGNNDSSSFLRFTTKVTSQAGPIFGGDEINKCLDPDDRLVAFKFYLNETESKLIINKMDEMDDFGSLPPGHPQSWYTTDSSKLNNEPRKCFLKLTFQQMLRYPSVPVVLVQSFMPNRQTRYGYSVRALTPTDEKSLRYKYISFSFACVEYRCSEVERETFIRVYVLEDSNRCPKLFPIRPLCTYEFQPKKNVIGTDYVTLEPSSSFYAAVDVSDGSHGLYSGPGKIAEERCKAGTVDDGGLGKVNSRGYAVVAVDHIACNGWYWERESLPLCANPFAIKTD